MSPSRLCGAAVHGNGHCSVPPEFGLPACRQTGRWSPGARPAGATKRDHGHELHPRRRAIRPDPGCSGQQCDRATPSVQWSVRCSRGERKWRQPLQPPARRVFNRQHGGKRPRPMATPGFSLETCSRVRQDVRLDRLATRVPVIRKTHGRPGRHGPRLMTLIRSRSIGTAPANLVKPSCSVCAAPFAWSRTVTVMAAATQSPVE